MENQQTLYKGELMEELLRSYFLNLNYYVVRSVNYRYEGFDITDIDLYLYGRSSSLTRQRINVDIKNKKSPQAFERILWANGLRKLLKFDNCIVATTDNRPVIHSFGQLHDTIILDGTFLSKLRSNQNTERISEDALLAELLLHKSHKTYPNRDWKFIYEMSKARLLSEQDFSGANSTLSTLYYFLEKVLIDQQRKEITTRMTYIILSHFLIVVDFIIKDIAFLEQADREKKLLNGFKFGNLGKDGVDKIITMAAKISGSSQSTLMKSLDSISVDILKDFFSKNDNAKNIFNWAREFEALGFNRNFINPNQIDLHLKGVLSVFLDYYKIDRRKFFESYT